MPPGTGVAPRDGATGLEGERRPGSLGPDGRTATGMLDRVGRRGGGSPNAGVGRRVGPSPNGFVDGGRELPAPIGDEIGGDVAPAGGGLAAALGMGGGVPAGLRCR
jgi:hypothetical protein